MKKKSKMSLLAVTATALTLVVAGCSSSTTKPAATNGNQTAAPKKAVADKITMVPQPGTNFQNNFNPFAQGAMQGTQGMIYQPLFYFSNVSTDQYPLLGTKFDWSNGNKTLTVTLRDGVKWSDGQDFTAQDVLFTFNLLKKYPAADTNGIWKEVDSITANGNQVVFNFKAPNVPFQIYPLANVYIVPEHVWSSLGDPTKATLKDYVGTGPYVLDSFNAQVYKMKANSKYYGGALAVKEVDFPYYSGNDSADLALAKGDIDWGGIFIPNIEKVYAAKNPSNKYWFPSNNIVMLYTNLQDPILKALPVRKAMSLAIDRDQLSKEAEFGYEPVASPTGLTLPNDQAWVDPSLPAEDTKFTYNADAAIKVLTDAGYKKDANGIFQTPDGKTLKFTLEVVSGWSDWDSICALISQQLKKIGMDVTVKQEEFGTYYSNINNAKYQMAISWTNTGPGPYYQYQNFLNSHGSWNLEKWSNPDTDSALAAFSKTTDPNEQKQAIYKIQKTVAEQLPSIPLLYGAIWYEYNDSKFTGWPDSKNAYANPAPFAWPAPAIVLSKLQPK